VLTDTENGQCWSG